MSLASKNLTTTTASSNSIIATTIDPEIIIRSNSSESSTTVDPVIGPMSYFKTERGGINLCMSGFRYQKLKEIKSGIKWWCCESRNKSVRCPVFLYTSGNQGNDDHPEYEFIKITGDHNHQSDKDKIVIQKFKSDLKEIAESPTVSPSIATYNQLAGAMKLETNQMAQLPLFNSIRKYRISKLLNF
jgi:hypothetical protein